MLCYFQLPLFACQAAVQERFQLCEVFFEREEEGSPLFVPVLVKYSHLILGVHI